ncbi:hypothetical protein [Streptomyces sp. NPDC051310]|uniref:hypothetical protein n=1 Tax=Streptomyces sp. NPDC051310 TaxID=3365649 RepID=UPI0037BB23D4
MRVRVPALAVGALIAGGLLLGGTPAAQQPSLEITAGHSTCNVRQMQAEIKEKRDRAKRLERDGAPREAARVRAEATAIEKRMKACIKAEEEMSKPFPG